MEHKFLSGNRENLRVKEFDDLVVKVSESHTLARKRWTEREHGEERVDLISKEDWFQGGEAEHVRRAS